MGTNLQAQAFYTGCLKTQQQLHFVNGDFFFFFFFFNNSCRALVNRAGRKPVRAGHRALRNMPSWNTEKNRLATLSVSPLSHEPHCGRLLYISGFLAIAFPSPSAVPSPSLCAVRRRVTCLCRRSGASRRSEWRLVSRTRCKVRGSSSSSTRGRRTHATLS